MTTQEKLKDIIEDELATLAALSPEALTIDEGRHRTRIAEFLASVLVEHERYRSGRRISDRLKDHLLDIQQWLKGRKR